MTVGHLKTGRFALEILTPIRGAPSAFLFSGQQSPVGVRNPPPTQAVLATVSQQCHRSWEVSPPPPFCRLICRAGSAHPDSVQPHKPALPCARSPRCPPSAWARRRRPAAPPAPCPPPLPGGRFSKWDPGLSENPRSRMSGGGGGVSFASPMAGRKKFFLADF